MDCLWNQAGGLEARFRYRSKLEARKDLIYFDVKINMINKQRLPKEGAACLSNLYCIRKHMSASFHNYAGTDCLPRLRIHLMISIRMTAPSASPPAIRNSSQPNVSGMAKIPRIPGISVIP